MEGADLRWMWLDEVSSDIDGYMKVTGKLKEIRITLTGGGGGGGTEYGIRPLESLPTPPTTPEDWR